MKFRDFIKDKILLIVTVILALISIEILLFAYNIGIIAQIYIAIIIILFERNNTRYWEVYVRKCKLL